MSEFDDGRGRGEGRDIKKTQWVAGQQRRLGEGLLWGEAGPCPPPHLPAPSENS